MDWWFGWLGSVRLAWMRWYKYMCLIFVLTCLNQIWIVSKPFAINYWSYFLKNYTTIVLYMMFSIFGLIVQLTFFYLSITTDYWLICFWSIIYLKNRYLLKLQCSVTKVLWDVMLIFKVDRYGDFVKQEIVYCSIGEISIVLLYDRLMRFWGQWYPYNTLSWES